MCRLLALNYPGESSSLSKIVARDAFLDSLDDPAVRIRILEKDCTDIQPAFSIASLFESYVMVANGVLRFSSARACMEESIAELKDGLKQLLYCSINQRRHKLPFQRRQLLRVTLVVRNRRRNNR